MRSRLPEAGDAVHKTYRLRGASGREVLADEVVSGAGREVVFLHGLVGLNEHWEAVVSRVNGRARCRTLELPLLDLTGDDCSILGVVELTAAYLRSSQAGPVTLIGNSFGGHVALRLALDHPELVHALVLAGSSGLMEKTYVRGAPVRPSRDWLAEKIGELFHAPERMNPEDLDRAHAALSRRGGARAMVRLSKSARRNHLGDHIRDLSCPTQLIWGRNDVVTPPSAAEDFKRLIPDCRLTWIDECGHAPMIERPEAFAEALGVFLDELDASCRTESVKDAERTTKNGSGQP